MLGAIEKYVPGGSVITEEDLVLFHAIGLPLQRITIPPGEDHLIAAYALAQAIAVVFERGLRPIVGHCLGMWHAWIETPPKKVWGENAGGHIFDFYPMSCERSPILIKNHRLGLRRVYSNISEATRQELLNEVLETAAYQSRARQILTDLRLATSLIRP